MPKVVRLSYDFVSTAESSQPKLVDRLAQLAKTEFTDIVKPKMVSEFGGFLQGGGVGKAHFNMATRGVAGGKTLEVRPLTACVLPYYLKTKSI